MINDEFVLYCANHPQTETTLRCNRCEKPICTKCAISTPTGYRCIECVRGQQRTFNTARWYDYVLGFAVAAVLSFIGSRFATMIGFFTILLAPFAGVIIAEASRFVIQKRRSKRLYQTVAGGAAIGSLPVLLTAFLSIIILLPQGGFGLLLSVLWPAIYSFTVTSTVYYRLSGIQIGR